MEYFEETRPRFLFQSHAASSSSSASSISAEPETLIKTSTVTATLCFSSSIFLIFSAFYFLASFQILNFLLVWIALSLLLGPFAPVSLTGGDVRVGQGEILEEPDDHKPEPAEEPKKRNAGRRSRRYDAPPPPPEFADFSAGSTRSVVTKKATEEKRSNVEEVEEKEWDDGDFDILKKQIAKHPVGTPRRWEVIAEAFGGRHGLESVIRTAKSLSEKRPGASDSFSQFLRQRKPLDKRVEGVIADSIDGGNVTGNVGNGSSAWSSAEDVALLNALKAFPKDTPMRWEKVEAAVPGKSKACCMKRVAELRRDFRISKASDV